MRKGNLFLGLLVACAVLAGEIALTVDIVAGWHGKSLSVTAFVCIAALTAAVLFALFRKKRKLFLRGMLIGHAVMAAAVVLIWLGWRNFSANSVYQAVDTGKEALFAGRRVMLIVPHQDDDINVLGGAMEEYAAYGSELYPVFVTNGDNGSDPEVRFRETLAVCDYIGVPRENVIFLGYGDQWQEGGPHLYNGEAGVVLSSAAGRQETYSTSAASVFREGRSYTSDHLLEDLQAAIEEVHPDVIFCSDYDAHIDHKATTLAFEKVMGRILQEDPDYRPLVFKGYAYKTAWYAEPDYYETNLLSTQNVFTEPYWQRPEVYRWEERVRLPVGAQTLARSIFAGGTYHTLALYSSQDAQLQAGGIINGDKVVWQRKTTSVCYDAEIEVSSNESGTSLLHDFMLIENHNLVDEAHMPVDGTWIPDAEDSLKQVTVTLTEGAPLNTIVLYDNPSETDNILDAAILLDDGTQIQTGALHPGGAATEIPLEGKNVTSFTVRILEQEGGDAGLTEIEAFAEEHPDNMRFIKLMDEDGNFAYDYWLDSSGKGQFHLYTHGETQAFSSEAYSVSWDNQRCSAALTDTGIAVECPKGETVVITVSDDTHGLSDSIVVSNPGKLQRLSCSFYQQLEQTVFQGYCDGLHWNTATYKILDLGRNVLKSLMQ